MAPMTPEEIDVFKIPHSRMKELVYKYCDMVKTTNFSNVYHLNNLLENLIRTFHEFIAHEQIENKYIMKKLKNKLRSLSIQNTAVCNCHKDNQLTDMLSLIEDGYKCTKKSDTDRKNFGMKLRNALEEFTRTFIPHMAEEEEVFQPLLMEHFTFEELKQIKCTVLEQHFKVETEEEKFVHDSQSVKQDGKVQPEQTDVDEENTSTNINSMPDEILLKIFSFLNPKDLSRVSQVSKRWNDLAYDSTLWKELYPVSWANGDWNATSGIYDEDSHNANDKLEEKVYDEDADIDESGDWDAESLEIQRQSMMLTSMCKHLLPRVGTSIQKCDLAYSKGITNGTLYKILSLCPNMEYLDLTQTRVSDLGFKSLEKERCGKKLRHLDLSGCLYITDLTLQRVSKAIGINCHKEEIGQGEKPCEEVNEVVNEKEESNVVEDKFKSEEKAEIEKKTEDSKQPDESGCLSCKISQEDGDEERASRLSVDQDTSVCDQCTDNNDATHCRLSGQDEIDSNPQATSHQDVVAFQRKSRNCSLKQAAVTRFSVKSEDMCCMGKEEEKRKAGLGIDCDKSTDCDKQCRCGSHSDRFSSQGNIPGGHGNRLEVSCHKFCTAQSRLSQNMPYPDQSMKEDSEAKLIYEPDVELNRANDEGKFNCKYKSPTSMETESEEPLDQNETYVPLPCQNDKCHNEIPDPDGFDCRAAYQTKNPVIKVPESNDGNQIKDPNQNPEVINEDPLEGEDDGRPQDNNGETPNNDKKGPAPVFDTSNTADGNIDNNPTTFVDQNPDDINNTNPPHNGNQENPSEDVKKETPNDIDKVPVMEIEITNTGDLNEDKNNTDDIYKHNKINMEDPSITKVVQTDLDDLVIELQDGGLILDLGLKLEGDVDETDFDPKTDPVSYKTFTHVENVHKEKQRGLEYLSLSGCYKITDEGIEYLIQDGGLPHLRYLDLSGCQLLSGQAVADLVDMATKLDPSNLFYCDNILDGPYPEMASGCQNLECPSRICCRGAE